MSPDADAQKNAMMIETFNARFTNFAMFRSQRSDRITIFTILLIACKSMVYLRLSAAQGSLTTSVRFGQIVASDT